MSQAFDCPCYTLDNCLGICPLKRTHTNTASTPLSGESSCQVIVGNIVNNFKNLFFEVVIYYNSSWIFSGCYPLNHNMSTNQIKTKISWNVRQKFFLLVHQYCQKFCCPIICLRCSQYSGLCSVVGCPQIFYQTAVSYWLPHSTRAVISSKGCYKSCWLPGTQEWCPLPFSIQHFQTCQYKLKFNCFPSLVGGWMFG